MDTNTVLTVACLVMLVNRLAIAQPIKIIGRIIVQLVVIIFPSGMFQCFDSMDNAAYTETNSISYKART